MPVVPNVKQPPTPNVQKTVRIVAQPARGQATDAARWSAQGIAQGATVRLNAASASILADRINQVLINRVFERGGAITLAPTRPRIGALPQQSALLRGRWTGRDITVATNSAWGLRTGLEHELYHAYQRINPYVWAYTNALYGARSFYMPEHENRMRTIETPAINQTEWPIGIRYWRRR